MSDLQQAPTSGEEPASATLQAGDTINVTVYGEAALSWNYQIGLH
jgi:hypothetical protein